MTTIATRTRSRRARSQAEAAVAVNPEVPLNVPAQRDERDERDPRDPHCYICLDPTRHGRTGAVDCNACRSWAHFACLAKQHYVRMVSHRLRDLGDPTCPHGHDIMGTPTWRWSMGHRYSPKPILRLWDTWDMALRSGLAWLSLLLYTLAQIYLVSWPGALFCASLLAIGLHLPYRDRCSYFIRRFHDALAFTALISWSMRAGQSIIPIPIEWIDLRWLLAPMVLFFVDLSEHAYADMFSTFNSIVTAFAWTEPMARYPRFSLVVTALVVGVDIVGLFFEHSFSRTEYGVYWRYDATGSEIETVNVD